MHIALTLQEVSGLTLQAKLSHGGSCATIMDSCVVDRAMIFSKFRLKLHPKHLANSDIILIHAYKQIHFTCIQLQVIVSLYTTTKYTL